MNPWAEEARQHWKTYRPKMYHQLEQSGQLESSLHNAAERANEEFISNIQSGMHPLEAQSEAKKNNLFLPAEEGQPELGVDPDRLPDPASLITVPGVLRRQSGQQRRKQSRSRVN